MKRTLSAILCAALCLVFALAGAARADIVKPNDDFYYFDDAGVMTDATRAMIYYNNVELQKACGAQIVVAAVKTLNSATQIEIAQRRPIFSDRAPRPTAPNIMPNSAELAMKPAVEAVTPICCMMAGSAAPATAMS